MPPPVIHPGAFVASSLSRFAARRSFRIASAFGLIVSSTLAAQATQPTPRGAAKALTAPGAPVGAYDSSAFRALTWRLVGPFRGGRANAITGVTSQPFVYYAGYTGGGVWKTENAGASWRNISDNHFRVGSIGAIAVA